MWMQIAVIGSALVTVVLVISSVRVGFTFLVAPIVFCESMLLAVAYLIRQALADDDGASQTRGARQAPSRSAAPPFEQAKSRAPGTPSPGAMSRRSVAPNASAGESPHHRHAA